MTFVRAAASADIADGAGLGVVVGGREVLIVRSGDALHATTNRCPHAGSRLDGGMIAADSIACPLHGARFRLETGECVNARLGYAPLTTYAVRELDGIVEIDLEI